MKIALDFDGTYDRAPAVWDAFIFFAKQHGHTVIVVTSREDTPENREIVKVPGCTVIFTNRSAKRWYCETQRNCKFDIWIDDLPETILQGL
jgi:hypothetical protein